MDVRFKEVSSRLIETVSDVASCVVVISDIHHEIVFCGDFIAFHQFCKFLICINWRCWKPYTVMPYIACNVFHSGEPSVRIRRTRLMRGRGL
jgi:hypothetical protein